MDKKVQQTEKEKKKKKSPAKNKQKEEGSKGKLLQKKKTGIYPDSEPDEGSLR